MSENWKKYKLNELVDYENGLWAGKKPPFTLAKVIRATEFNDDGTYTLETAKELQVESNKLKNKIIQPNKILLERSGGGENKPVGRVIFLKEDVKNGTYSFSNFTTLLIPKEKIINPKFLFYYLHFFYISGHTNYYQKATIGIRNLEFKKYLELDIPVPLTNGQPDLKEQQAIVDKIDKLFIETEKGVEHTKTIINFVQEFNNSMAAQFFRTKKEKLERVPLRKVLRLVNGRAFKPAEWSNSGLPIVRIQNLNNQDAPFNFCDFKVEERYYIDNGELLISWSGTPGTSFGAFIWNRGKAVLNQHIFKGLPASNDLSKEYLVIAIKEKLDEMILKSHGGVGLRHITKSQLENIELLVPYRGGKPDLNEQEKIVERLRKVSVQADNARNQFEKQLQYFKTLNQSILNCAFTGKLVIAPQEQQVVAKKVNIFPIQQAIGVILQSFERGEMIVAKMLYMAQEVLKAPLGIQFTPQNFGPYDAVVKRAITSGLVPKNQFFTKKRVGGQEVFAPGAKINNLMKYNYRSTQQVRNFLNDMSSVFQSADSPAIERLATVCKIVQDNKTIDEAVVKTKMQEWKPGKFQDQDVVRALNFIKTKGWDKVLTQ